MPLLWAIDDETRFHQAIAQVSRLRQTPFREANYRHQHREAPRFSDHVLRPEDEMQLADHVALIAHSSEGPLEIAAVCIEEQPDQQGLRVRLARNELKRAEDVESVRGLLRVLESCASGDLRRSAVEERLFNQVLAISQDRILQRLMPPWLPAPSHWNEKQRRKRTSLHHRVATLLLPRLRGDQLDAIRPKLTRVLEALEPLESKRTGPELRELVKTAVRRCADASAGAGLGSLELQLEPALDRFPEAARKVVAQVDKVARYLNMSRDLAKMATNKAYRRILGHITLEPLLSPSPVLPNGAAGLCFVHAEVQLLLHYERVPREPAPRFIGCSKSACFLCDMLIKRHGKLRISFSHQRIYPKWTVPNVDWMTQEQVEAWRETISGMTRELQAMVQRFASDRGGLLPAPLESRACLPLSSVPSSVAVPGGTPDTGTFAGETQAGSPQPQQSLPSVSRDFLTKGSKTPLEISSDDLPISYRVLTGFPGFRFVSSQLMVFFEFDWDFSGTVSLVVAAEAPAGIRSFAVDDLAVGNNVRVAPVRGDEGLGLRLQVGGFDVLHVELTWDSA
ncbi:hypothetical protein LX36DRAFT_698582 [Colletotrichum falcatum]|nr:hypothetical protein LX36DRAFT_698582 [Colletotrichum falcatum]